MDRQPRGREHPASLRWPIGGAGLVAAATWLGIGLPYSLFTWLLDAEQWRLVVFCYAWEVPVVGALSAMLLPQLWWREVERCWDRAFGGAATIDPAEAAALERTLLDYPMRVARMLTVATLVGYGLGAVQLRVFALLPDVELFKVGTLGIVTGMISGLFAILYLEWLLAPLLRHLGAARATAPPAGRRVPLYFKVFACSIVLTLTALLLLGPILYSSGERILEQQIGDRILTEARHLAADLGKQGAERARDLAWWRASEDHMNLGKSGYAYLVDEGGAVVAGSQRVRRLAEEGFRSSVVQAILSGKSQDLVDRVLTPRIVASAPLDAQPLSVVAVAYRHEFEGELDKMLWRGVLVFAVSLLVALTQGFLFSRQLTRPIEVVTRMASSIAKAPGESWKTVAVRTNDEVGELATAFNQMTGRLEQARDVMARYSSDLENRVVEATRSISTLYDVARTITSTLEIEDVLHLVAEKTLAALGVRRLVLLHRPADSGEVIDAYATGVGGGGKHLEIASPMDLSRLCSESPKPTVVQLRPASVSLPPAVVAALDADDALCLPLAYKDELLGVIVAGLERPDGVPDLELASALATQAATALANAALFEKVQRHQADLEKLSQMRAQAQEESLRAMSRELHDGVGQVLTAIKMDLSLIERTDDLDAATLRTRVRDVRQQVTELLQEVRNMSQLLRPSMLDDFGLVPTLQWFVEKFAARTDVTVELRAPSAENRLPNAIEVLFYRVTQEALTNVAKHANAHRVEVTLAMQDGVASLKIADDGVGCDLERLRRPPASESGLGLIGMRERAEYYGGSLEVRSRPGEGMQVTLSVPLDAAKRRGAGGSVPPAPGHAA